MAERGAWLSWATFCGVAASLYLALLYAPEEVTMGPVQRIFYWHVGAAWVGLLLAFSVVFVASLAYLRTRHRRWDTLAHCSAEIGVLFTTIVLLTGPIWGKAAWNTYWTWDPRLTTTLVLWFIYVAYLVVRGTAEGSERKARLAAAFGIIGYVDVPLVFLSIRWWRTIHPVVVTAKGFNMTPEMVTAMLGGIAAFTLLYFWFMQQRLRLEELRRQVADLKDELREGV
ncbi:MAG: cytochrome c biogenesis protein [Betaproteobacteria bacterium]